MSWKNITRKQKQNKLPSGIVCSSIRGRSMNSKSAGNHRFRLFTPNPPDFFPWGVRWRKTKQRIRLHRSVSFQIRLVATKQAGPTRLFFCITAVKPSEFTERTLNSWAGQFFHSPHRTVSSDLLHLVTNRRLSGCDGIKRTSIIIETKLFYNGWKPKENNFWGCC